LQLILFLLLLHPVVVGVIVREHRLVARACARKLLRHDDASDEERRGEERDRCRDASSNVVRLHRMTVGRPPAVGPSVGSETAVNIAFFALQGSHCDNR
jgi:hypothetical protein